jgi:hypothetical protein
MKKLLKNQAVTVSDTLEVGIPFGKSYYKRTPKVLRIVGDSLLTFSLIVTALGAIIAFPPNVIAVAASAGIAGKFLSNCFSNKE